MIQSSAYKSMTDEQKADAMSKLVEYSNDTAKREYVTAKGKAYKSNDYEKTYEAEKAGISKVYAGLLPQDKLSIMKDLRRKEGSVLFVGDGINDAPVLAGADAGAAMGSGADAAIEAADVVFLNSDVHAIPQAIKLSRKVISTAWQNVAFALFVKIAVMIMGLLGYANMWVAVFADTGVTLLCILYSVRLLRMKL